MHGDLIISCKDEAYVFEPTDLYSAIGLVALKYSLEKPEPWKVTMNYTYYLFDDSYNIIKYKPENRFVVCKPEMEVIELAIPYAQVLH